MLGKILCPEKGILPTSHFLFKHYTVIKRKEKDAQNIVSFCHLWLTFVYCLNKEALKCTWILRYTLISSQKKSPHYIATQSKIHLKTIKTYKTHAEQMSCQNPKYLAAQREQWKGYKFPHTPGQWPDPLPAGWSPPPVRCVPLVPAHTWQHLPCCRLWPLQKTAGTQVSYFSCSSGNVPITSL